MQSYCLESKEDMALGKEDKTWVAEEIRAAVKEQLSPHGWRKLQQFLPLVGVLGILVALLALAGAGWKYAFSRVEAEAQFQTHTTETLTRTAERLTSIEGKLTLLQAQITSQKYSAVPLKELRAHAEELKQLKTTVAQASPSTPGYWPIVFHVIQLASQSTFADWDKIAATRESVLNNVTSRPPGAIQIAPNQRVFLQNHVEGMIIKNSIVRFDPSVELVNDVFIDCVFLLPVQDNPSKPLQEIGKALLASELSKVTLNAS